VQREAEGKSGSIGDDERVVVKIVRVLIQESIW
jgi:hypothetical protein